MSNETIESLQFKISELERVYNKLSAVTQDDDYPLRIQHECGFEMLKVSTKVRDMQAQLESLKQQDQQPA